VPCNEITGRGRWFCFRINGDPGLAGARVGLQIVGRQEKVRAVGAVLLI
jgi:hypothetical protein